MKNLIRWARSELTSDAFNNKYKCLKFDGFVKSPISALRFISCSLRRT